jgi:hypothetical protein
MLLKTILNSRTLFAAVALACSPLSSAADIDYYEPFVDTYGTTSTNVLPGADISHFHAYDTSSVQVTGGSISFLNLLGSSIGEIAGGNISWVNLYDSSSVRITYVQGFDWLVFGSPDSHAEIVADNVSYASGHLSGVWGNGMGFSFWAMTEGAEPSSIMPTNITITAVPEANSLWLLAVGLPFVAAAVRRRQV